MRLALALAVSLVTAGLAAAAQQPMVKSGEMEKAGWTYIALSDDVLVYMKDATPLKANGKLQVWTAYDSLKPRDRQGFAFKSVASLGEYDCAKKTSRILKETFYAAGALKGKTWVQPNFVPTEFAGAAPGSIGDLRLDFACRARPVA